jgi:hypothetical protein
MIHRLQTPAGLLTSPTEAAAVLTDYFSERLDGTGPIKSGAMFERFVGGGDTDVCRDRVTVEDLVAVSMLEVNVPAQAALRILDGDAAKISEHLGHISTDLDLADAPDEAIDTESHAWQLWKLLIGYHGGMGPTKTSKLLARKRPRLLPVQDTHVLKAVGGSTNLWADLRMFLREDEKKWSSWLREVRALSGVADDISELRVFDILVWTTESNRAAGARKAAKTSIS